MSETNKKLRIVESIPLKANIKVLRNMRHWEINQNKVLLVSENQLV